MPVPARRLFAQSSAALVASLLLAAAGCRANGDSDQSYEDAVRLLCDSPSRIAPDLEPAGQAQAIGTYARAAVKNAEARQLIVEISGAPGKKKAELLRAAARRSHLDGCALADLWVAGRPGVAVPAPGGPGAAEPSSAAAPGGPAAPATGPTLPPAGSAPP